MSEVQIIGYSILPLSLTVKLKIKYLVNLYWMPKREKFIQCC